MSMSQSAQFDSSLEGEHISKAPTREDRSPMLKLNSISDGLLSGEFYIQNVAQKFKKLRSGLGQYYEGPWTCGVIQE